MPIACQTARSGVANGESLPGMYGAFLAAGAQTVVGALWGVEDVVTRRLMTGYHTRLARGEDRIEAFTAAVRGLRNDPATSDPFFWAPFVVCGEGGPLTL